MTTEPQSAAVAAGPKIFVIDDAGGSHPLANATIRDAGTAQDLAGNGAADIWRIAPGTTLPDGAGICVTEGLAAAVSLSAEAPDLTVIPRAEVARTAHRYGFSAGNGGSGFSTYQLDPATVAAFSVAEAGRNLPLDDWLTKASALGFDAVWLHGVTAEAAGLGFPCDMLAKAHRIAPDMAFWISGGGWQQRHFDTIAPMPGLAALVVPADVLSGLVPAETAKTPQTGRGVA